MTGNDDASGTQALVAAGREDARAGRVQPFAQILHELGVSPGQTADKRTDVVEAARQDLLAIHRHLAVKVGRGHADAFAARLADRGSGLADTDRGRPVDGGDIRSILIAPYRIYYEVAGEAVTILAVSAPTALSPR